MHRVKVKTNVALVYINDEGQERVKDVIDRAECDCGYVGPNRQSANAARLDKYRHQVDVGDKAPPRRRSKSPFARPRDGRKNKVYAAEKVAFPTMHTQELATIHDVRKLLDSWTNTQWFKARYLGSPIDLDSSNGSFARGNQIRLQRAHYNRYVLAHELAHVLTLSANRAAHDKTFCGAYIAIVTRFIGKEEGDALRAAFVASKIPHRWALPIRRKRNVTTKKAA